jgi:hypothetical protein
MRRGPVSFDAFADFGAFWHTKGLLLRRFCEKRVNFGAFLLFSVFFRFLISGDEEVQHARGT